MCGEGDELEDEGELEDVGVKGGCGGVEGEEAEN